MRSHYEVEIMVKSKKNQKAGYITSRTGSDGMIILVLTVLLAIFVIISIYSIILTSGHAASLVLLLLFAVPLMFILGVENNAFPNLPKRKYKSTVLFYFTAIFVIPMVFSVFIEFNIALLITLIIFGVPMIIAVVHLATDDKGWIRFSDNSKKVGARIKKGAKNTKQRIKKRFKKKPKRRLMRNK
jgi:hypothetical protein